MANKENNKISQEDRDEAIDLEVNPIENQEECPQEDSRIAELEKELEELRDRHLRLAAEYDNYRRRTIQEKSDLILHGGEKTLLELLPVLDDLDLAHKNITEAKDIDALREGLLLIMNKFGDFLTKQGLSPIDVVGQPFDADTQQAVAMLPIEDKEQKGIVIDCIKKGYKLHDKVIRFADVVVGQ